MTLQLLRQFIACKGNALAAMRLYRLKIPVKF